MPNQFLRKRYIDYVKHTIAKAESSVNHSGITGTFRENALADLLKLVLSPEIGIGTGKIVDSSGEESSEIDLILYNKTMIPPILTSEKDEKPLGVFPVEACLYAIEVKSTASNKNIKDAIKKAQSVHTLSYTHAQRGANYQTVYSPPIVNFAFFAFASDLKQQRKTDIERYKAQDPYHPSQIVAICIAGKGYWFEYGKKWYELKPSKDYDEVIEFLCGVVNTIPNLLRSRIPSTIGDYIIDVKMIDERKRFSVLD